MQNQASGLASCTTSSVTRVFSCHALSYTSMVGQAGASQDAPVADEAGKANPVWFRHP
ncbi:ash family protein [Enterobacteriaceae bacterium RIT814]|nr:ash family protein [Enterobacteriaceae bacterium RIT 814]